MLNLFCTITIQEREPCWHDSMNYMFSIIMCQGTCEPICFKHGMMLNTTNCSLIPVWMTLMVTLVQRGIGKVELVLLFFCKVALAYEATDIGRLCKEADSQEALLVWQKWIIWAFALLVFCLCAYFNCDCQVKNDKYYMTAVSKPE